ncbi:hypothetical protein PFLU3_47860 [Pseudomonas fluorescens]|uniref:Uncharacterized protein n=1 Tax=Pseudomonas fluorescens TaxID=294 RepID=A0A0D0TCA7_PSEFL|nr:hypothetical protein C4K02_2027 [Pseudomonas synxantha]KIR19794.1 hypothetical protein PFLU3_47860 [Pseudomonas fluorescens]
MVVVVVVAVARHICASGCRLMVAEHWPGLTFRGLKTYIGSALAIEERRCRRCTSGSDL